MVSPGRKLQCISYQHIKFILYLYELKHILLKRMYFREDLPERLNWLAKDIVVFKFCAFLQLSKNVSLKSFFTIRIIHCYIQYFILFYFFFPLWPFQSELSSRLSRVYHIPMHPADILSYGASLGIWENLLHIVFILHLSHQ